MFGFSVWPWSQGNLSCSSWKQEQVLHIPTSFQQQNVLPWCFKLLSDSSSGTMNWELSILKWQLIGGTASLHGVIRRWHFQKRVKDWLKFDMCSKASKPLQSESSPLPAWLCADFQARTPEPSEFQELCEFTITECREFKDQHDLDGNIKNSCLELFWAASGSRAAGCWWSGKQLEERLLLRAPALGCCRLQTCWELFIWAETY